MFENTKEIGLKKKIYNKNQKNKHNKNLCFIQRNN